ncbi:hypothetical protein NJT12_11190 [Flavobacterium sp. AC]|uniref:RHS repeat-associated protein n=1 Tax=Flavobacterium azizsancarii TaxID=2961580 RepID=A0ABT4WCI6_9FLAO|nr:RHS repeat-associated core domain-containing protein [Flavobacterium azizsancarii]MDA6070182.1 hypothetical protein [Flavobacterium azizsancarii]
MEYIAFGEVLFEEHSSSFSSPYLFNGKKLHRETNLSYYGARYYDDWSNIWYGVDRMSEKYPHVGAYVFSFNNPGAVVISTGGAVTAGYGAGMGTTAAINLVKNLAALKKLGVDLMQTENTSGGGRGSNNSTADYEAVGEIIQ